MYGISHRKDEKLIGLLMILAVVLVGAAWFGGQQLQRQMLIEDASGQARQQAIYLENRLGDLDRVMTGRATPEDQALIDTAMGAGGALRYEILDSDGVVVRASERGEIGTAIGEPAFWDVVRMGDVYTTLREHEGAGGSRFVSETYVPFVKLGRVLGAIRVQVDATISANMMANQIRNAQWGIVALWLLLGGFYARTVARSTTMTGWPRRTNRSLG